MRYARELERKSLDHQEREARNGSPIVLDGLFRLPWHRRTGESRQAYEAFRCYLDTAQDRGQRSIRRAARKLGKSRQLLEGWSPRWSWGKRAEHYDTATYRLSEARAVAKRPRQ